MKDPIFKICSEKLRQGIQELKVTDDGIFNIAIEQAHRILADHKEALVMAWLAETGLKPSESEIVTQITDDGKWHCWVQEKRERIKSPEFVKERPSGWCV